MDNSSTKEMDEHSGRPYNEKDAQKTEGEEGKDSIPLYKLFLFADPMDIMLMILGAIAAIGNGFSVPLMSFLLGELIDTFGVNEYQSNVVHEVSKVCMRFIYLGVGSAVASFFQLSCWMITGERQSSRIRNLYLKTILRQDMTFFDMETDAGQVVGRMSGDIYLIQDAMGEKVGKSIQLVSTFVGGFVVAFFRGWLLALVMISTVPFLVLSGVLVSMTINKLATRGQGAYVEAANVVEQTICSIKTVQSFTGETMAFDRYNNSLKTAYNTSVQEAFAAGVGLGLVLLIVFCSYALAVWFGSLMILEKGYTGGDVINVIFAIVTGSKSLGEASPCVRAFAAAQAAAFTMFQTIKRKPEIDSFDTGGMKFDDIQGDIELKGVYFSYPSRPKKQIFSGFSLSIPSGTTTALIGESGSGKSTVISLIERFYDPQAGEVLIDGINIKEFQLRWIRERIGLVCQEPVLFASSIRDNIAYGKDDSTPEQIRAAAELANASIFIDKMPQGLDTMVGESGNQLSGGQKQRVAIARAILRDPRILLFDEATSALDTESEWVVQEALEKIMTKRTTIIVAHRLTTVRNSDVIAVIDRGVVVEKGTHSELVNMHGAYSHLITMQEVIQDTGNEHTADPYKQDVILGSQKTLQNCFYAGASSPLSSSVSLGSRAVLKFKENAPELNSFATTKSSLEVPMYRLAYLNRPELPMLIIGSIAAAVKGSILPVFGALFSITIKMFFEPEEKLREGARFWMWMLVIFGFVAWIASVGQSFFFGVAGSRLIRRIRSMSFEKVVHMDMAWFDEERNSSSMIATRLSLDAAAIRCMVGDTLSLIVQNSSSVIFGLVIAFEANWQLSLIVVALLPLLGFNAWVSMKFTKGFSVDAKIMYEEAGQVANDAIRNIRTVASFCAEEKVIASYKKKCEGPQKAGIRLAFVTGIGYGLSFLFLFSGYATSFYAGARLVEEGETTFEKVFRVFFALCLTATTVSHASSLVPDATKAKASTASIFSILDRKSEIDSSDVSGLKLGNVKGHIEFKHVSFTYPTRRDSIIFQDLCLDVQSGKMVALIGESGCGKSTIISLLQRFYNPDSGNITLDGVGIQGFQLKWLRKQMGLVSQEPILFNDTVRANIAYGKEGEATEAEILAAAEAANAHNFISGMQEGYNTLVGERGVQLSGGQKQRVAIARAILKTPKILLLDEATSALDTESERVVQDALERVMVERTTIVVAHRLSTIKNADLIAVVKNGVIAEKGKHESLLKIEGGVYASLVAFHLNP